MYIYIYIGIYIYIYIYVQDIDTYICVRSAPGRGQALKPELVKTAQYI